MYYGLSPSRNSSQMIDNSCLIPARYGYCAMIVVPQMKWCSTLWDTSAQVADLIILVSLEVRQMWQAHHLEKTMILSLIPISSPNNCTSSLRWEGLLCLQPSPSQFNKSILGIQWGRGGHNLHLQDIWCLVSRPHYLIFFNKKLSNNAASCIFSSGDLSWKF